MPINKAQRKKYWWEFSQTRKALLAHGVGESEIDEIRHDLHKAAGVDKKSHRDFTNIELNRVISEFQAARGDAEAAHSKREEVRIWLVKQIDSMGLDEDYLNYLSRRIYRTEEWRTLDDEKMEAFRNIARARARAKARK